MRKALSFALIVCLLSGPAFAQQPLPIRRILLYKNGMAYIVRAGEIRAPLNLTFRPDEMNDVLKTFTAWNPNNSVLYPVGYTTGIAAGHLLERFPFDLRAAGNGLAAFLRQIKGARLRLDVGARTLSGQLIAIVEEDRAVQAQTVVKDHRLTVLSGGSIQSVWLSDVRSLEFEDPDLANQLRSYLEILAEGRQDVTREVTVYPASAAGPINVSYVQHFPVWKTSYRLDLARGESRIQGWSQIDNPTGETWDNVDLTLVSGMPSSFIMELYQPLYTSRHTVNVPLSVVAAPRQYETALNTIERPDAPNSIYGTVRDASGSAVPGVIVVARHTATQSAQSVETNEAGYFAISNLPAGMYNLTAQLPGFETFSQRVQLSLNGQTSVAAVLEVASMSESAQMMPYAAKDMSGSGPGIGRGFAGGVLGGVIRAAEAGAPPPLRPQQSAAIQAADAARVHDYFEYRFPFAIQLGGRQSALLPFLNKPIKAERVSIFKSGADTDHPLNGAWIENNAELPLEPGPVTFFQEGRYAGEAVIEYLSRGERRLVSYGVDYDIQANTSRMGRPETITRLTAARGVVTFFRESVQTTSYRFRNKGQEAKPIVLEHPREPMKTLRDVKPEESTATFYRFRIVTQPGQEIEFPVSESVARQTTLSIQSLDRPTFDLMFSASDVPSELRSRVANIIQARERLSDLQQQRQPIEKSIQSLFEDQTRLRENLKALGDSREERDLRQKYLAQLDSQEQQVQSLRARLDELTRQVAEQQALVSRLISELSWG